MLTSQQCRARKINNWKIIMRNKCISDITLVLWMHLESQFVLNSPLSNCLQCQENVVGTFPPVHSSSHGNFMFVPFISSFRTAVNLKSCSGLKWFFQSPATPERTRWMCFNWTVKYMGAKNDCSSAWWENIILLAAFWVPIPLQGVITPYLASFHYLF